MNRMYSLFVGTIFCLCLVIVNSKEEREVQERGGHVKFRAKRTSHGGRGGHSRRKMDLRLGGSKGMGIMVSAYNVATGVKGMLCHHDQCYHYGDGTDTTQGTPKWEMKVGHKRYLCNSEDVQDCPEFQGWKYRKFEGKAPKGKFNNYQIVVPGKVFICQAHSLKQCPRVPHHGNRWETVTREKVHILARGNLMVMCMTSDTEKCYKIYGKHNWLVKDDISDYNGIFWYIVEDGIKYYCTATKKVDCREIPGAQWRRYCSGKEVEECGRGEWELNVNGVTIICVADSVYDCKITEDGEWKPSTRVSNRNGKPEKTHWYTEGVSGVTFYCDEPERAKCPDTFTEKAGIRWEEIQDDKWMLNIKGKSIKCLTNEVKYCKKIHKGKWKHSNRGTKHGISDDHRWVIVTEEAKIYCDAKASNHCPKIKKHRWEPLGDGEPETKQWELTEEGKTIGCVAHNVINCQKIVEGHWNDSNKTNEDTMWWVPVKNTEVYCDELSSENCPKVLGRHHWEHNPGNPHHPAPMWWKRVKGEELVCIAFNSRYCKKIHEGHWKRRKGARNAAGKPNKSKWWILVGKARVYCNKNSPESCPDLGDKGGGKWKEVSEGDQWELGVGGERVVCIAGNVDDCKKIKGGSWKSSKDREKDANGMPKGTKWFLQVGKIKFYCVSESSKSCPELEKGGGKWQKVPGRPYDEGFAEVEQIWELGVGGETVRCIAHKLKDCEKIREGGWTLQKDRNKDTNGVPEGAKWWIRVGGVNVFCNSKSPDSCPKLSEGGAKWQKVPGSSDEETAWKDIPFDSRNIDAGKIAPGITGGGRFMESENGEGIRLCYGVDSTGCPEGMKWKETQNEVGNISQFITGKNIWVLHIGGSFVVCIANELSFCKPKSNGGWKIIAGMKSGLWKTTYKGVLVYCEAAIKTMCPEGFGDWGLVSEDQWIQKQLDPNKKGEMWRMVSFDFTAFCDADFKGKCPKFEDHLWHKVFDDTIDYKKYERTINFKREIKNTLYYCKANSEDECPELPYSKSWTKIYKKVSLKDTLKFFEDIVGFEDDCRSGICKLPKNLMKEDPFE